MTDKAPRTATRFRIDENRRWMIAEFIPDAGDGHPSTAIREPTDEETAAASPPSVDALERAIRSFCDLPATLSRENVRTFAEQLHARLTESSDPEAAE